MRVRFQADNDLDQRIVVATLRLDPAIDFRTAPAAGLHNVPDEQVLAYAAREGRVLVSHDRRTMPEHFGRFLSAGAPSPGLIIVSAKLPVGRAAEWLHLLWEATSAEEYVNSIYDLP
jgi:predicted nuclease of predicted toxin-antitoxin system